MANYKNPSFRGFYKVDVKAEPDWAEVRPVSYKACGFYNRAGCFGKMGVGGFLTPCLAEIEKTLSY